MITCHRKYLEERCLERGFALEEAMPCVVSMNGDMWTINADHDSYPRGVGTLSFKCVEDCSTPEFPCEPGLCCTENPDGTNSCLPCSSSSSELRYECHNYLGCITSTYGYLENCDDCLEKFICDSGSGCQSAGYYLPEFGPPDWYSDLSTCGTTCTLTNTGCDPVTGACSEGYGAGYANPGGCPECTACHVCDANGWTFVAFREGGCGSGELGPGFDPANCKEWFECDPISGCSDKGYTLNFGSNYFEGTCATQTTCILRNTGCGVEENNTSDTAYCNSKYTVAASPYNYEGSCPFCEECVFCSVDYGIGFAYYRENCAAEGYDSGYTTTCSARYQCNSTNGNCDFIGYYTDSTAPYGSTDLSTCETTCKLTNTGCDPSTGACYEGYGLGYPNPGGCPECVVTNTGCDPSTGACDQMITAAGAGYPNPGACDPNCTLRSTGCNLSFGCTQTFTTDSTTYPYEGACDSTCVERYSCDTGNGNCDPLGYFTDSSGYMDQTTCGTNCILRNDGCNGYGPCSSLYTPNSVQYPYEGACDSTCVERFNCNSNGSCDSLDYYTDSNAPSGSITDCNTCLLRNTGCNNSMGCSESYTTDSTTYPYEGACDSNCVERWTDCNPTTGSVYVGYSTDAFLPTYQAPNCVERWTYCDPSTGSTYAGYGTDDSGLPTSQISDCVERHYCDENANCVNAGYFENATVPANYETGNCSAVVCPVSSSSSSSECICDPATGSNPPGCDSECLERWTCDPATGPTSTGYSTDASLPTGPDALCVERWTACDNSTGSTYLGYTTDTSKDITKVLDCLERSQCEVGSAPDFSDGGCKSVGYYTDAEAPSGSSVKTDCDTNCLLRYNYCCINSTAQMNGDTSPWACDYQNPQHAIGFYTLGIPTAPDPNCGLRYICGKQNGCCELGYFTAGSGINSGSCETDGVMVSGCDGSCKAIWSCDTTNGPTFLRYSVDPPGSGEYDDTGIADCILRNTGCDNTNGCSDKYTNDSEAYPNEGPCDPTCVKRYECVPGTYPDYADGGCKDRGYYTDSGNTNGYLTESYCNTNCLLRYNYCCYSLFGGPASTGDPFSCDLYNLPKQVGYYTYGPTESDPACGDTYCCNPYGNNSESDGAGCSWMGYTTRSFPSWCEAFGDIGLCEEACVKIYACSTSEGKQFIRWDNPATKSSDEYTEEEIGTCGGTDNTDAPCNCKSIWSCNPNTGPELLRYSTSPPDSNLDEYTYSEVNDPELGCIQRNTGCVPEGVEDPLNPGVTVGCYFRYSMDAGTYPEKDSCDPDCVERHYCDENANCVNAGYFENATVPANYETGNCSAVVCPVSSSSSESSSSSSSESSSSSICPAGNECGDNCCNAGETCVNGSCCPAGQDCNGTCCNTGETCIDGSCCPNENLCERGGGSYSCISCSPPLINAKTSCECICDPNSCTLPEVPDPNDNCKCICPPENYCYGACCNVGETCAFGICCKSEDLCDNGSCLSCSAPFELDKATCECACPSGSSKCGEVCCDDTNFTCIGYSSGSFACCAKGEEVCTNGTCLSCTYPLVLNDSKCICECPAGRDQCGDNCCETGETCINGSCCPAGQDCNGVCCTTGETCINGSCCPAGQDCNGTCCTAGDTCVNGSCCPAGQDCNGTCCSAGETCIDGSCCIAGCTDSDAQNYNPSATCDDGSCLSSSSSSSSYVQGACCCENAPGPEECINVTEEQCYDTSGYFPEGFCANLSFTPGVKCGANGTCAGSSSSSTGSSSSSSSSSSVVSSSSSSSSCEVCGSGCPCPAGQTCHYGKCRSPNDFGTCCPIGPLADGELPDGASFDSCMNYFNGNLGHAKFVDFGQPC